MLDVQLVGYLAFFVALVPTLLAQLRVGHWAVRISDFPRMQILALSCIAFAIVLLDGLTLPSLATAAACLAIAMWQGWHVLRFMPLWNCELSNANEGSLQCGSAQVPNLNGTCSAQVCCSEPAVTTALGDGENVQCPNGIRIRAAAVNVKFDNKSQHGVLTALEGLNADLLLVIEMSKQWELVRDALTRCYEHTIGVEEDNGHGIRLFSRFPFRHPQIQYLVSPDRPSISADIELGCGQTCRFVGVHPTPPGLYRRQTGERLHSRIRDGELSLVAQHVIQEPEASWIVTGDFNDVAWSHTTRLFKRLSGLKDPRVGRGMFNTYHAHHVFWRFPIDHVFLSRDARIYQMDRFAVPGSDHFGIVADFAFARLPSGRDAQEVDQGDIQDAANLVREGRNQVEQQVLKSDQ